MAEPKSIKEKVIHRYSESLKRQIASEIVCWKEHEGLGLDRSRSQPK